MTPFDQQHQHNHLQGQLAHVDQKIEERESLRHSTHRSQRSDKAGNNHLNPNGMGNNTGQSQLQQNPQGNGMTASDRFGNTDFNGTDNQERHAFQKGGASYNMDGEGEIV
mmetsp:Transcript_9367/g.14235  ORF Transcript_9367/g.14235 Transcript_9367/m.14235 type:complete len:110 (-) Transcript_9367:2630-2959(-)